MINKDLKLNLRHYRELKGFSQNELAKKVRTSQGYISEIEKNIKSPTIRMLYNICVALEICPCMLLPCIIEYRNKCECEDITNENSNL